MNLPPSAAPPGGCPTHAQAPRRRGALVPRAAAGIAAAALTALFVLQGIGRLDLWDPDEANYAETAREMILSGDWVVPHSNYRPYLEKPPLVFWAAALTMRLAGPSEAAARLPAALSGLLLLVAVAWWAHGALPPGGALASVLTLGTSVGFLATARLGILDLPLTACVTVSILGFERRVLAGGGRRGWFCFYAGMAAGCLAKGALGLALPLAAAAIATAVLRPTDLWRRLDSTAGVALFLLITVPSYAAMEAQAPGFLRVFFLQHHLLRFIGEGIPHRSPFARWAYVPLVAAAGLPWCFAWPRALADAWRKARAHDPLATLLLGATLFPLAFFTLSATRLPQYALPALPPLCLLVARQLAEHGARPARLFLIALAGGALFTGLEIRVAAPINAGRSLRPLAQEGARRAGPGEPLLSYRLGKPYASVFYSARRVRFVEEQVTFDQFVASPRPFWILIDEGERAALERRHQRPFPAVAASAGRCLITNRPPP